MRAKARSDFMLPPVFPSPFPLSAALGSHRVGMGCRGIRRGSKSLNDLTVIVIDVFVDSRMQGLVLWDTVGTSLPLYQHTRSPQVALLQDIFKTTVPTVNGASEGSPLLFSLLVPLLPSAHVS